MSILAPLPFVFCLSKSELSICRCHMKTKTRLSWQPCVVVSALASINEVNQRRARLVLRWVLGRGTPPPQTSPPRRLRRLDPLRLRRLRRLDTCAFDARPVPPHSKILDPPLRFTQFIGHLRKCLYTCSCMLPADRPLWAAVLSWIQLLFQNLC